MRFVYTRYTTGCSQTLYGGDKTKVDDCSEPIFFTLSKVYGITARENSIRRHYFVIQISLSTLTLTAGVHDEVHWKVGVAELICT